MNCLRRSNITTVGELIGKGTKELLKLRNFGQKSYQEIQDRLDSIGLSLDPKIESEEEAESGEEPLADDATTEAIAEAADVTDDTTEEEKPGTEESEDGEPQT